MGGGKGRGSVHIKSVNVDTVDTIVKLVSLNRSSTYLFASENAQCSDEKQECKSKGQDKCECPCSVLALLRRTHLCGDKR